MNKLGSFFSLLIVVLVIPIGISTLGLFGYAWFLLTHTSNPDDLLIIWFLFPISLGISVITSIAGAFIGRLKRNNQNHDEKQARKNFLLKGLWSATMFSALYWLWWIYNYTLSTFYKP